MVEGDGLLNRCTVKSRTEGSNPSLSAIPHFTQSFQRIRAPLDLSKTRIMYALCMHSAADPHQGSREFKVLKYANLAIHTERLAARSGFRVMGPFTSCTVTNLQ